MAGQWDNRGEGQLSRMIWEMRSKMVGKWCFEGFGGLTGPGHTFPPFFWGTFFYVGRPFGAFSPSLDMIKLAQIAQNEEVSIFLKILQFHQMKATDPSKIG